MDAPGERQILRALLAALDTPPGTTTPPTLAALDPSDPSLPAVARHHRLTPLLGALFGDGLAGAFGEVCRRDRTVTIARNLLLAQAAEECLAALAARGIDGLVLKGLAYEPLLYGRPGCRPTGDVDLLVREQHRRAAFQTLLDLGYEPKAAAPGFDEPDYHEVAWTRGHVEVDLHLGLAPRARCAIDYRSLWAEARPITVGQARAFRLSAPHAAAFHALHLAIDHFDVPALYLVDLGRLLPTPAESADAGATARAWRCHRAFTTAVALTAAFLPDWGARQPPAPATRRARRIIAGYGPTSRLPRAEQLRRKLAHLDGPGTALRYVAVQARRNARELVERHLRHRSPRQRLGLAPAGQTSNAAGETTKKTS